MIKKLLASSMLSALLVACSQIPKEAFYERGSPEALLDTSSEVVNLKLDSPASVQEITNWVNQDQPTRAELGCAQGESLCDQAQDVLHQFGVPVKYKSSGDNGVVLVYERVQARDCESRYIDNPVNPYNLNHPTFGCSLAVNAVQMVSDKRQFTNPALMDSADATKTTQTMGFYGTPSSFSPSTVNSNFPYLATVAAISGNTDSGGVSSSSGSR